VLQGVDLFLIKMPMVLTVPANGLPSVTVILGTPEHKPVVVRNGKDKCI
jgi:hypothetical protein